METPRSEETYSEDETVARREAAIQRMLATKPLPHKLMKKGAQSRKVTRPKIDRVTPISD